MLVKTFGSALTGIDATTICVEVNISVGINFFLVGLPDNAVKESLHRISAAFETNGLKMPGRKITVNLSPADLRKEGSAYDLPIALGILGASDQISAELLDKFVIMGELSLDGTVRPIKGALPIAIQARKEGFRGLILPAENAREAAVVDTLEVYGVNTLAEVIDFLNGKGNLSKTEIDTRQEFFDKSTKFDIDFNEVKGQTQVKRALEIAAAGGHNVIMIGTPGSGKTMLAKRIPTIMPPMTLHEALETTKIHSVAGKIGNEGGLITHRPFRSPHHNASEVAIVGGGSSPVPGEISLSHNGILFLDELPEFSRSVIEVLRQPLEDKRITIARARYSVEYPSNFMLVASMNPCPCGYLGHPSRECTCTPTQITRYMSRVSGPVLDRIDMHVEVSPVPFELMTAESLKCESSDQIRQRVIAARNIQTQRFAEDNIHSNAMMESRHLKQYCQLDTQSRILMNRAMERLGLSARAHDRILKVARTIADLDAKENIQAEHIAEAIGYRSLDRSFWGVK